MAADQKGASSISPAEATGWNFTTFEKYINQRFGDLSLQLRERYEAQQTGVTAALAAAGKGGQRSSDRGGKSRRQGRRRAAVA